MTPLHPRISVIVAMARNRVIGANNQLPWHLPADLQHFKKTTMGRPIIMGRRTHESIGRALPGRLNIVLTRQPGYRPAAGGRVAVSLDEALAQARAAEEVFIIGGASLYREALPLADRIILTEIHAEIAGDTYFPPLNPADWRQAAREDFPADAKNPYPYSFIVLDRVAAPPRR